MRSKQVQILSGICGVQLIGYVCRAAGFKADIWIGVAGSVFLMSDSGLCVRYLCNSKKCNADSIYRCGRYCYCSSGGMCCGVPVFNEFFQIGQNRG